MGQYVFDPVQGGYVYQPDWWEQAGQAAGSAIGGPIRDASTTRDAMNRARDRMLGGAVAAPAQFVGGFMQGMQSPSAGAPAGYDPMSYNPMGPNGGGGGLPVADPLAGVPPATAPFTGGVAQNYTPAVPEGTGPINGQLPPAYPDETGRGMGATTSGLSAAGAAPGPMPTEPDAPAYPDETGRGMGALPPANVDAAAGGSGGDPNALQNDLGILDLANDGSQALYEGYQQRGINPEHNRWAKAAIQRYGPMLEAIIKFSDIIDRATGGDGSMTKTIPTIIQGFMNGTIDPNALLKQVMGMAGTNEEARGLLTGLGPEALLKYQSVARGSTDDVARAVAQAKAAKIRQARAASRKDMTGEVSDDDYWLKIIGA